jgi:putative spermidine/putrescine transport system permease protein
MSEEASLAPSRVTLGLSWLVLAFLLLPITIVLPVSLTDLDYLALPRDGLSLKHYLDLVNQPGWLQSFGQSAVIGVAATGIATLLGTLAAIGCWRRSSRLADAVRALLLLPLIVPSVVYALGLYRFWIKLVLLDSYTGVIIAHAVTGMPYVVITVSASLAGFNPRLEQAARNLGASSWQSLRLVILPNILPGIASGAIFAFIHSWDELVIVLFIASRSIYTLPRRMWDGINDQLDPAIAAVATLLILISIGLLAADRALRRRRANDGMP